LFAFILALAGTLLGAYGAWSSGQAAKDAADYNARVARQQAQAAREKAALEERRQRKEAERLQATARARAAASSLTVESFLPVFEESAREAELDALIIRYGGEMEAFGYASEAELEEMRGKQAKRAGIISTGKTLLGGGLKTYKAGKEAGLWGTKKD